MKTILQGFLLLSFFWSTIFANDLLEVKKFTLKKDEQKKILVKYASVEKIFKFRWTLYQNGGLVILRSYDRVVAQNVLYLRHNNRSFRLELRPKGTDNRNVAYILVKFQEFNQKTNEAKFSLFLSDDKLEVYLKYLN